MVKDEESKARRGRHGTVVWEWYHAHDAAGIPTSPHL